MSPAIGRRMPTLVGNREMVVKHETKPAVHPYALLLAAMASNCAIRSVISKSAIGLFPLHARCRAGGLKPRPTRSPTAAEFLLLG